MKVVKKVCSSLALVLLAQQGFATDFTVQTIDASRANDLQLEGGKLAWIERYNDNSGLISAVKYFDGSSVQYVAEPSSTLYYQLDFSDGVLVFAEYDQENRKLYKYENGVTTLVRSNPNHKFEMSSDNGQVVWGENFNDVAQVMFYDGNSVQQITNHTADNDSFGYLNISDGVVSWKKAGQENGGTLVQWSAQNVIEENNIGEFSYAFTALNANTYWIKSVANEFVNEIYSFDGQATTQLTNDLNGKSEILIDDNTLAYKAYLHQFKGARADIYLVENGATTKVGDGLDGATGEADVSNGSVFWNSKVESDLQQILEYKDGETSVVIEIEGSVGVVEFNADAGQLAWVQYEGNDAYVKLAKPVGDYPVVNLGSEHTKTALSLEYGLIVEVSQWSGWSWTPGVIGFGVNSTDGAPLDGVQVRDAAGNIHTLNGWWDSFSVPFNWEPVQVIFPPQSRSVEVEWWAAG